MSSTKWTVEQKRAIELEGTNILVSAGAGSGKTAVLTERILRKLKSGVSLRNLIVLTFTKAAAFEMKERIRKNIIKELNVCDSEHLKEELSYIDQANIQTFDSFSLFLVKKYNYLLGVDKNIKIGDTALFSLMKKRFIDEIFEKSYNDSDFIKFVKEFTIKNDESIKDIIIDLDSKLDLLVTKDKVLDEEFSSYFTSKRIEKNINKYLDIIKNDVYVIKQRLNILINNVTDSSLKELVNKMESLLLPLFNANTYEEFLETSNIKFPQLPRKVENLEEKEMVSNYKSEIGDLIKSIQEKCSYKDINEMRTEVIKYQNTISVISKLIKELDYKMSTYKRENNIYEFIDIAKMAIKLMRDNSDIRNEYRSSINEILVDEYQDTSDIQETLVNIISNNNVYMVGDIKQSIYRFRNANPDIFKEKYDKYKKNEEGVAIDLSKNFRSRSEVLSNINEIFSKVMNLSIGGADYNNGHALIFGNTTYDEYKTEKNDMQIISYTIDEACKRGKKEIEGKIIVEDILEKMNNHYQVYDRDLGKMRDVRFDDFAILTSDKSSYDIYKKIFDYYNVPLTIHRDFPFIDSIEIVTIRNLLKCIYSYYEQEYYNENFNYSFISLLRSFLVCASDEDIFNYFVNKTDTFNYLINLLKELAIYSKENTIGELLELVYQKFNVFEKIYALTNVNDVENRLNYLLNKAYELSVMGYGLGEFIVYLEYIFNSGKVDIEFSQNQEQTNNVCNLLTIHKSKGLEYNICYFPELTNRFNQKELKERIIFDNKVGLISSYFDEGIREPFTKTILKYNSKLEEISEKIRLFYVALTRAKDKIVLVTPQLKKPLALAASVYDYEKAQFSSFYDLLSSVSNTLEKYTIEKYIFPYRLDFNESIELSNINETSDVVITDVKLEKQKIISKRASISSNSLISKEMQNTMDYGTLIHSYLEIVNNASEVEELNVSEKIKTTLRKFFSSDIFKEKIISRYHEYEFSYSLNNQNYHGFIDLVLETVDKFIIIDYKLKNVEKEEYIEQLRVYYNYLKEITDKKIETYLYSIINNEWKYIEL